jgi:protein-tyrosine phosphatase|tara:strand:+ start:889 stop:1287 length:399 start_codon:yes stop_codon:yes gene_type:complete
MPTEIISGLWFGDIDSLKNPNFFTDNDINIIINLTDCNFKIDKKVSYINVPLSTYNIYSMKNVIGKITENIHNNIELNNIYVYCLNGITISPLVCSLYLLKYGKLNKYDIPPILKSKNDQVLINIDEYDNLI